MHENPYQSPLASPEEPEPIGPTGRCPAVPARGFISFEFIHNCKHVLFYATALSKGIVEVDGRRVFEERSFKLHDRFEVTVGGDQMLFDMWTGFANMGKVFINGELAHDDIFNNPATSSISQTLQFVCVIVGGLAGYLAVRFWLFR